MKKEASQQEVQGQWGLIKNVGDKRASTLEIQESRQWKELHNGVIGKTYRNVVELSGAAARTGDLSKKHRKVVQEKGKMGM